MSNSNEKSKKSNNFKEKDIFLNIYAKLSTDLKKEIILVIDDRPITWDDAYKEIYKETELGSKILKKLTEMGFI